LTFKILKNKLVTVLQRSVVRSAADASQGFVEDIYGKNLIINKLLYGLKTSAEIFHEHLAESLSRLGFRSLNVILNFR
jgi:hypothetical protein